MRIHGLPDQFWVVTRPTEVSTLDDICFACTFERLMLQVRGGLQEDEIVGIYADEKEARQAAAKLLGECAVRPEDALFTEVLVHVMAVPKHGEMTAKELAKATVEAVTNAVRQGEEAGFRHRLNDQVSMGAGPVELRNQTLVTGQDVYAKRQAHDRRDQPGS